MSAWLTGLQRAHGEWVFFVDSDDWVELDAIETLLSYAEKEKVDIVCGNYYLDYGDEQVQDKHSIPAGRYDRKGIEHEILPYLITNRGYLDRGIRICRWAKLISRDCIIANIKYCNTQLTIGEDMNIIVPTIANSESIYIAEGTFIYHYRMNNESMMKKLSPTMWNQVEKLYCTMNSVIRKLNVNILYNQLNIDFCDLTVMVIEKECRQLSLKQCNFVALKKSELYEYIKSNLDIQRYAGAKKNVAIAIMKNSSLAYIHAKFECMFKEVGKIIRLKVKGSE